MSAWMQLCDVGEAPAVGQAREVVVQGVAMCLANVDGVLGVVDNVCPHRGGPLAEGWIEEGKIVCPWHAWGFDIKTGVCAEERSQVKVYPLEQRGVDLFVDLK